MRVQNMSRIIVGSVVGLQMFNVVQSFLVPSHTRPPFLPQSRIPCVVSPYFRFPSSSLTLAVNNNDLKDTPSLATLFKNTCDSNTNRITKKQFMSIPLIADMWRNQDLSQDEINELWSEIDPSDSMNLDSFIQLYRKIDNLFEEEEVEDPLDSSTPSDSPLEQTFQKLCVSGSSISRSELVSWSEIQDLFQENLLSQDEFDNLWSQALQSQKGSDPSNPKERLTFEGFEYFNTLLEDLFVLEEEEEEEKPMADDVSISNDILSWSETPEFAVYSSGLTPQELFAKISNEQMSVSLDLILKRWGDLQDMIRDGDLSQVEVLDLYQKASKSQTSAEKLDCNGFIVFYKAVDSLFEDEEEDDGNNKSVQSVQSRSTLSSKDKLLTLISDIERDSSRLPCGLECTEGEIQRIGIVVKDLERESSNLLMSKRGNIKPADVAGTWELVYTSSSALKFNKGISGLVPPTGKFGGLVQKLKASKFMLDLEYIESVNAGPGSFEVRVTGDWEIKSSVSLFTGEQAIALKVEPNLVLYGITTQKADHWKSLGPMNLLDISYLDDDLRIMRGTTASESIFVFKRM